MPSYLASLISRGMKSVSSGLARRPGPRSDDGLPLGLRIGSHVMFEDMPFDIAEAAGLSTKKPPPGPISAFGTIDTGHGSFIYRFYLDGDYVLQIATNRGEIDGDPIVFHLHQEIDPGSPDQWYVWIPKDEDDPDEEYQIGIKDFTLRAADGSGTEICAFARYWPTPSDSAAQVPPIDLVERLQADPELGAMWARVERRAMMYARNPDRPASFAEGSQAPVEWLFVSTAKDGDESSVEILTGLSVGRKHIVVGAPDDMKKSA